MDIKFPEHVERSSGSAITMVDSHGVHVAFGSFTNLDLEDMDIRIEGAIELEGLCAPYVAKAREMVKPGLVLNNSMWKPEREHRDSLPERFVRPLRNIALKIALEHFSKHPNEFMRWLKEREESCFEQGRQAQARKIRESLMLD